MTYIDHDLKVTLYTVCMLTTSMVMMGSGKFGFLEASFICLDRRTVPPTPAPPAGRSPSVAGSASCPAHPSRVPGREVALGDDLLKPTPQLGGRELHVLVFNLECKSHSISGSPASYIYLSIPYIYVSTYVLRLPQSWSSEGWVGFHWARCSGCEGGRRWEG